MSEEAILVVEDDLALLAAVRDILELAGYRVFTATNGLEGLDALNRMHPDVIVSDIMMPKMDGYQFFEAVRSRPAWLSVPFIFLSAKGEKLDIRLGKELGADDYVTKPFDEDDLLVAVRSKIKRRAELQAAREEELSTLKNAILTTLNHEFRTPLTYITAYAEMLSDGSQSLGAEEFQVFMRGLKAGSARLSKLVEDLLLLMDLLTGEAAAIQRQIIRVEDVAALLASALDTFRKPAQARKVALTLECPPNLPAIRADPAHLEDALGRLIDNAIKFSQEGGTVRVSAQASDQSLRLAVQDQGIGIRPEEQARLFDFFHQVDRAKLEQQGLGCGLAICRAIVELHGGRLSVESRVGAGSMFVIELPAQAQP